jgi:hypothetical protein
LRLSAAEIIASANALTPLGEADVPVPLARLTRTERADAKPAVTKEFHQSVDALATTLAEKLSSRMQECEGFGTDQVCTETVLSALETDLLRSAPDAEGHTALSELVREVAGRSGAAAAFRVAVRAVALSPKSLYLTEGIVAPDGALTGREKSLRGKELASFLSYRLLGTPASPELVAAVGTGAASRDEVQRLVDEQFGTAGLEQITQGFLESWLRVREIGQLSRSQDKHPDIDAEFFAGLEAETRDVLARVAREPRIDLLSLLTAPQPSSLVDAEGGAPERPGVFSLPGVLATASSNNHTNIPRRGRFFLKSLFCRDLPNPPPGAVDETPPPREGASERERFEGVEAKATCKTCHAVLDPLAFPFEVYDEIGQWRSEDEHGNTFDTTGTHETQDGAVLEFSDVRSLMELVASDPTVRSCVQRRVAEHIARQDLATSKGSCGASSGDAAPTAGASFDLKAVTRSALVEAAVAPRGN